MEREPALAHFRGGGRKLARMNLAVCSWSLQPESVVDLIAKCRSLGVSAMQLALDPVRLWQWRPDEVGSRCRAAALRMVSGMVAFKGEDYSTLETIKATGGVRPDATWAENLRIAEGDCLAALRLGLGLVTFHAGFLPHEAGDAERGVMIERLRQLAEIFAARNIRVAFETGQESAETLEHVLADVNAKLPARAHVGVNFDPANMILYAMGDPVEALRRLMPYVRQVHIKDAVPTKQPGTWGEEVAVGTGAVDWAGFFAALKEGGYRGALVLEREAGTDRMGDLRRAVEVVHQHMR